MPTGQDAHLSKQFFVALNHSNANIYHRTAWSEAGSVDAFKEGGVILAKLMKTSNKTHEDYGSIFTE